MWDIEDKSAECNHSDNIQPCTGPSELKKDPPDGLRKELSNMKLDSKLKSDDFCSKRKKTTKNTKPERSRSGRMIKRKKFSSESEFSELSDLEMINEEKEKYSTVKGKVKSGTSESDTEDREFRPSERESSDVDMKEELSQKSDKKTPTNKKSIRTNGTNIKNKSKEPKQTQQSSKSQNESNKQIEKAEDNDDVISKLNNFMNQTTNMTFSNLGIQVSLNAVNEIKPDVLTTLRHCQRYSKNEFVRHKAKHLYTKFKNNFLDLEKICSSMCAETDGTSESIASDIKLEDMNSELPQYANETGDELQDLEKINLLTFNSVQQNENKKNSHKKPKKGNSAAVNHRKNVSERLKNEKWGKNMCNSKVTGDAIDLLSSNLAMMKSLEIKKETMEDAFGNFVAHQLKSISDPVLKDRIMSRIMSLIMEEKYE